MLGSSSLGRWGRSVAPLAVLLALAAAASLPGQAQVENTHEGAIAVLGPDSGGPAYEFAAQVLAQALGGIHVPVMTRGVPVPTPPHPGIVFLLPQTVDGDRLSALRRFRDDGGRIVTFGVQDEAISEMLGLTCRMESDPLPQPLRVVVEERHLPGAGEGLDQYVDRIASVSGADGEAVAWYGEAGGAVAGWLADDWAAFGWVPTPGDSEGLQRLLGALVARFDEEAALLSFQAMLDEFAVMGGFSGLGVVQAYVDRQGTDTQKRLLDAALGLRQEALAASEEGSAAAMMAASVRAEGLLRQALYGLMPPAIGEMRAVFAAPPSPGGAEEFVADLVAGGINAVFLYVGDAGTAAYRSDLLQSPAEGDPLAEVIAAAARRSEVLDVFAWHCAFQAPTAPEEVRKAYEDEGRLVRAGDGTTLPWLCPSVPANIAHEQAILTELLGRYPVRGVLLDFMRLPSQGYCYCDSCRDGFLTAESVPESDWPPISAARAADFTRYRQKTISRALTQLATDARTARPGTVVGATLFPSHRNAVAQDVDAWVGSGALDLLVPLYYGDPVAELRAALSQLLLRIDGRVLVVPARRPIPEREAPMDPLDVLRELEELRQSRVDGVALYAYDRGRGAELIEALGLGAFSAPSEPPYSVALDVALPPRPFPQAELQGYPPAEPLSLSVSSRVPGSGSLRISAVSMDGPQQTEVGTVSLVDGAGTAEISLVPGAWRLTLEGRLDAGGETIAVRRNGPALRVMSQREYEQARDSQARAETLDIALLSPGRGTAPLADEMRLIYGRQARVEFISTLTLDTLRQWDILVISDPLDLNLFTDQTMETLRGWAESGGRVLVLHNAVGHAGMPRVFLELADAFADDRVRTREIRLTDARHPAASYIDLPPTIELSNEDHVLVRPNRLDIALLEPAEGSEPERALAVAAPYGRGRVILCGLRLGQTSSGEDSRMTRDESLLLEGMLSWLAEGVVASVSAPAAQDEGMLPDADPDQGQSGGPDPEGGAVGLSDGPAGAEGSATGG